jgi:hypothetical protein
LKKTNETPNFCRCFFTEETASVVSIEVESNLSFREQFETGTVFPDHYEE